MSYIPATDLHNNFESAIYTALLTVPEGYVISYGELASRAGYKGYARHVGRCLKNLPKGSSLPWQRVIKGSGELAFPAGSEKYHIQREKLLSEGVAFKASKVLKEHFF